MSFTYRGTTSDSMFFNVTERQVYNAPAFDVNAIEVPGRSGDVLNSQQRFKNKTLVYTGFIRSSDFPGNTQWERLSRGLRNIKAWICGDAGKYHDLTDDYDPGFIRRAFVSGETAINILFDRPDGATITITFMAEPFMYEVSEPMELPETKSASGDIITITDGAENTPLKSAVVNIEPVQDLHGYSYPWPGGGGKNLITPTESPGHVRRVTDVTYVEGNEEVTVTSSNANNYSCFGVYYNLKAGTYAFKYQATCSDSYVPMVTFYSGSTAVSTNIQPNSATTFTLSADALIEMRMFTATYGNGSAGRIVRFYQMQLETGATATAWTPYSNICPISGWTQANVWVKPTYDTSLTPTATISLGQTVYGGTVDVVRGKLVVDRAEIDLGSLDYIYNSLNNFNFRSTTVPSGILSPVTSMVIPDAICSMYPAKSYSDIAFGALNSFTVVFATSFAEGQIWISDTKYSDADSFKAAVTGQKLVYKLATPIEIDLTPVSVNSLLGQNNIWANTGETEVEYIVPTENPTQWPSQPRLEITMSGAGTLTVNGKTWSIGSYTGTLICDSEIMDWYDAGALKNSLVSGDGFPELVPGDNVITYTGGITKVVATPRWRTL